MASAYPTQMPRRSRKVAVLAAVCACGRAGLVQGFSPSAGRLRVHDGPLTLGRGISPLPRHRSAAPELEPRYLSVPVRRGHTPAPLPSGAGASEVANVLGVLGKDALIFLGTTVAVVPACKMVGLSPVLGFLAAGLALGPSGLGLLRDLMDLNALAGLGISFLLFEQGLELSLDRLKALSRYAFGLGTLQVVLCTLAFSVFPFVGGVQLLEIVFRSPEGLVNVDQIDEALVIGAALSLSSSAFVLKTLQEKGQNQGRFGRAVLGVLLLQDIAVVPLLVLLPIIESGQGTSVDLGTQLGLIATTIGKAVGGLGAILVAGRFLLRRVFGLVAGSRDSETFVALCLLVALGVGQFTDAIGLSETLGAFAAGTLLAETNYRTQIEADIAPFRGLLLGLFFMTTGASVDPFLLLAQWPTVLGLLLGLLTFKSSIITALGLLFGLTPGESARTGALLSGGGEFAFVVLALSRTLGVLPDELNRLLIGVVVLSMSLTPVLSEIGDFAGNWLDKYAARLAGGGAGAAASDLIVKEPDADILDKKLVVICGFGPVGQIMASLISNPVISSRMNGNRYVAFDRDPARVRESRAKGFPVFYGDGAQPQVLRTAGVRDPTAFVVTYSTHGVALRSVARLREAFPTTPIFTRANDYKQYISLQDAGATAVVSDLSEIAIRLGSELLEEFAVSRSDEVQKAKMDLRRTLVDLARKEDIEKEFGRRYSPDALRQAQAATATASSAKKRGSGGETLSDLFAAVATLRGAADAPNADAELVDELEKVVESFREGEHKVVGSVKEEEEKVVVVGGGDEEEEEDATLGVIVCRLPEADGATQEEDEGFLEVETVGWVPERVEAEGVVGDASAPTQ